MVAVTSPRRWSRRRSRTVQSRWRSGSPLPDNTHTRPASAASPYRKPPTRRTGRAGPPPSGTRQSRWCPKAGPHRLGAEGKPPHRLVPARGVGDHQRPPGPEPAGIDAAEPHEVVPRRAAVGPHNPAGHRGQAASQPASHLQTHRVDPDGYRGPARAHPDRPRPHGQRTRRHTGGRRLQLQAAGHPVAVGVDPQQGALLQQHPHGILTDRDRDRGRPARQRHPSGHRQPGGNRGGIGPHRARGRLGPSGVAFGEVAGLQAPHHDQGDQHHHHASGHQPPVASCYVHADSRSYLRPVRQIVYLAPPSRPTHPVRAAVATRRDAGRHGRHPRGAANAALGRAVRAQPATANCSGHVHPLAAYLGWLYDAGFEAPEHHRLVGQVQAVLLIARKPADG